MLSSGYFFCPDVATSQQAAPTAHTILGERGEYSYLGFDVTSSRTIIGLAAKGTYTYTGFAAFSVSGARLTLDAGQYIYTGRAAIVTYAPVPPEDPPPFEEPAWEQTITLPNEPGLDAGVTVDMG